MSDTDSHGPDEPRRGWKEVISNPGQVPCVRRSFLTGITSGMGIGVGYFFMTSNVRRATNTAFGSYLLITFGTWFYCRYNTAQERVKQRQLKRALQHKISSEGLSEQTQDV